MYHIYKRVCLCMYVCVCVRTCVRECVLTCVERGTYNIELKTSEDVADVQLYFNCTAYRLCTYFLSIAY